MPKRSSNKEKIKDVNELAAFVIKQTIDKPEKPAQQKNPHAVALGRLGGLRGGLARAEKLTIEQRKEIAQKAARTRWHGKAL